MQPISVLSLRSEFRIQGLSSQPSPAPAAEQTIISGCWVLVDSVPLCENLSAFPSAPLLLHSPPWLQSFTPPPTIPHFLQWRDFLVCGIFSSFPAPSQRCRSLPYSFVSVFFFFLLLYTCTWGVSCLWEVWRFLPAFSRCSVGVVPHVDVFLCICGEEGDLHILLLCHLEGLPTILS